MDTGGPALSVVVAIVSDIVRPARADQLQLCLRSLLAQVDPPAMEILVPHYPDLDGVEGLEREFPEVRFLEIPDLKRYTGRGGREHHNELRARGVAASAGKIVALTDDHSVADEHWCARIVEAHAAPAAAIGGAVENGSRRLLNRAVYFCDFGQYQNPVKDGTSLVASDANVSYKRSALESIRPVWREVFHEGAVNRALVLRGERIVLSSRLIVCQSRLSLGLGAALRERFIGGWSFGAGQGRVGLSRLIWVAISPALPCLILARMIGSAVSKRRDLGAFAKAFPLMAPLVCAWCLGEMAAYLRGARAAADIGAAELPAAPRLSVVVVVVGDKIERGETADLADMLEALERQTAAPFEVIVPCAAMAGVVQLRARYPDVRFLPVEPVSLPASSERADELRAMGVAAARGDIIAVTEDHVRPDEDWSEQILQAHRQDYAAIGGAVENNVDRFLSWAVYFTDLGRYHNPVRAGASSNASVVNVSYKRAGLECIRAVWERQFHETAVHAALLSIGAKLALSPRIVVRQYRRDANLGAWVRDFFSWARSYGSTRARLAGTASRLLYICRSPLIPAVRLLRSGLDVIRKRRLVSEWLKAFPGLVLLTLVWSCGELTGYLAGPAPPRRGSAAAREAKSTPPPARAADM